MKLLSGRLLVILCCFCGGFTVADYRTEIVLSNVTEDEFRQMGELMRVLRQENRDDLFVPVARLQLLYLIQRIEETAKTDEESANQLRKFARGVAFNIASFTWPGWDEPYTITDAQRKMGLSAAHVGLLLAEEAGDVTSNILWINAVHLIADSRFDKAVEYLEKARDRAGTDTDRSMHQCWIAFATYLEKRTDDAWQNYRKSIEVLRTHPEEQYSSFYADQLETAERVFARDRHLPSDTDSEHR